MSAPVSGHFITPNRCLLYPQKRTLIERVGMSALCQKQTFAASTLSAPSGRVSGSRRLPPGRAWGRHTYVRARLLCQQASPVRGGCLHRGRLPSMLSSLAESPPLNDLVLLESLAKTRRLPHDLQRSFPASAYKRKRACPRRRE